MIVAGIGCRRGVTAAAIEAVLGAALARAGLGKDALSLLATAAAKSQEAGIATVASALGVPLVCLSRSALEDAGERTATRSARVLALAGVPSIAEAAALAAAGKDARLLLPRIALGGATCALATSGAGP